MSTYLQDAISDAQDTARNFLDEIVEAVTDNGEASDDLLNDYGNGDSYHHESHVDKAYNLQEAAELLDCLSDYEETDSGLWDGQQPRDAISTQAAYTYGNAVYSLFRDLIKSINDDVDLSTLHDELNEVDDTVQAEYDEAEGNHKDEQAALEEEWNNETHEEGAEFEEAEFTPPFDVDDETDKRKEALTQKIQARIEELINEFDG